MRLPRIGRRSGRLDRWWRCRPKETRVPRGSRASGLRSLGREPEHDFSFSSSRRLPPSPSLGIEGGSRLQLQNEKSCSGFLPQDLRPEALDPRGTLVSFRRHRLQRSSRPLRRPNRPYSTCHPQSGNVAYSTGYKVPGLYGSSIRTRWSGVTPELTTSCCARLARVKSFCT